jgi:hypothetical protein
MAAPACKREARTPVHWIGKLRSAEWEERRKAAVELRKDGGPLPEATHQLLWSIQYEQNPEVCGEMLITLGASGAAEAKPIIDARIQGPDEDVRKAAKRALKEWLVRNSLMGQRDDLPPPPHAFYGPVHVPPGAPASRALPPPAGYYAMPPPGVVVVPASGQPPPAPPAPPATPAQPPGETI